MLWMLSKRVFLASQYSGEWRQKGFMDSMSPPQIQIVFIASLKPCLNLYSLRWLKLRRNLVNSFIPYGLWISKMLLGEGLINSKSSLLLWWDRYIQSRKRMSLKFTGEYVSWQWRMMHILKKNLPIIQVSFENWHKEFDKF